ncbi:MAG TPA: hypothetical protein VKM56_00535 [Verrucomicrobiae bacterium]|nr:hypothetical protein [Verrucomicrobiae bacterium]
MKGIWTLLASAAVGSFVAGCQTVPPGAERGPHGTMAYDVLIDASAPGARVEANGEDVGATPVHIKIFGDPDGTFHDFGSYNYVVRALPVTTNQFEQVRVFQTGHMMTPEDRIPQQIYFDMNKPPAAPAPGVPVYGYPPPPAYYYGPPYYGPSFRFYYGPRYYRRW